MISTAVKPSKQQIQVKGLSDAAKITLSGRLNGSSAVGHG